MVRWNNPSWRQTESSSQIDEPKIFAWLSPLRSMIRGIFTKWPCFRTLEVHQPGFFWNKVEILPIWTTFLVGIHLTSLSSAVVERLGEQSTEGNINDSNIIYQLTGAKPQEFVAWLHDFDTVSSTGLMAFHLILKSTAVVSWKDTKKSWFVFQNTSESPDVTLLAPYKPSFLFHSRVSVSVFP